MTKKEEAKIAALLASLWERNLTTLHERLNILERAAVAAESGNLTEELRAEALDIAHKLSGNLGMFGYDRGTEIARDIQAILTNPSPEALGRLTALTEDLRRSLIDK